MENDFKERLANLIVENLKEEFSEKHISLNLVNTIQVYKTEKGWAVEIPAEMYDINLYNKMGVINYTGKGSYADYVDKYGGFSKTHKNYIENCINKAIRQVLKEFDLNGKVGSYGNK